MGDRNRRLRMRNSFCCRALPTMRQIYQSTQRIQALDGLETEPAQARIARFQAAVAQQFTAVIGQLHDPDTEPREEVEAIEVATDHSSALESVYQTEPLRFPGGS